MNNAVFLRELGTRLKTERKRAGLSQDAMGAALGMKTPAGHSYVSRLEQGKFGDIGLVILVRYLQGCKAPIGKFMLELAQSGVFGEAEAESVIGFTSRKLRGETYDEQARRAKARLVRERQSEREAQDADIVARLWLEVLAAMQPLLPPDPTRFMAHYLEVVRGFYRAWKLATRGALNRDPTLDVQMAFDRIEQNALERLVPAAVRKMREIVFDRLMKMTPHGGIT